MNTFLKESKKFASLLEPTLVVLGNEACDLDSAVSAIALAYFLHRIGRHAPRNVIPVLNIPRKELPLKTEVTYFLQKKSLDLENLVCNDEIRLNELKEAQKLSTVLVDHNFNTKFGHLAVQVLDHHQFDPNSNLPETCEKRIELVGSCASIVADHIFESTEGDLESLSLLYAAIVLDTVNFSKDADKARELDFRMAEKIEKLLNIKNIEQHRVELMEELIKARSDVSSLNAAQILYKDLKIIKNPAGNKIIAIPGFPISVEDFVKKENSEEKLREFAEENNCDVILLMGLKIIDGVIHRDLGLINIRDEKLFEKVSEALQNYNPSLQLEARSNISFMSGQFFKQLNLKASRKQILPLTKAVLDTF
ncbi:exopolyphosphatase PRUNE1 [Culicoides brevitarsis]|uniref:exopolyphosphatase PRUNE1 n=1 Tax=Culicoides brevitarsis TaxID=469753 RepID=UPI00307B9667